jgi:CheY-like chemotaxis protein
MARILIVDDEPGIRCLLERLLEEQGHEVLLAENGWSGLELFCRESPDVIVLDLKMPGIAGLTALQQIRRLNPGQAVIILTGAGTPENEEQVRALGVADYFEKEGSLHRIGESVRQILCTVDPS